MTMLAPRVISLIGCDVNEEHTLLANGDFFDGGFSKEHKRVELVFTDPFINYKDAMGELMVGVVKARSIAVCRSPSFRIKLTST
jgi:hypothetical protein